MDKKIAEILDYWYEDSVNEGQSFSNRFEFWFGKNNATDEEIKLRFSQNIDNAILGNCASWLEDPQGRLAYIILIDQFCRQVFRGTTRAFEHDQLALSACLDGISLGHDLMLARPHKYFYYLPLEHSENLKHQQLCVATYQAMSDEAPDHCKQIYIGAKGYAQNHLAIIEQFGRFPHRNEILGRVNTAQELEFLKQPGSSF